MSKFNLPSLEELYDENLKELKKYEELHLNENNPHTKNMYAEHIDFLNSILKPHKKEIRDLKINKIIND